MHRGVYPSHSLLFIGNYFGLDQIYSSFNHLIYDIMSNRSGQLKRLEFKMIPACIILDLICG